MSDLTVAVLGTGIMGAGMARSLLREGIGVRAWNRTRAKAEPLAADGARVCDEPADAVAGADVVLTMLRDADTIEDVMTGALPAFDDDAVWAQTSTVGAEPADRLARLAAQRGVTYFDAPVLGTKQPAEEGKLLVMVAGPTARRERVQPVFDAIGSRVAWVGEGTEASRLKLVVNSWVLALTTAIGEAMAMADGLGLDPKLFLEAIAGGPLDVQYAHAKGGARRGPLTAPRRGRTRPDAPRRRAGSWRRRHGGRLLRRPRRTLTGASRRRRGWVASAPRRGRGGAGGREPGEICHAKSSQARVNGAKLSDSPGGRRRRVRTWPSAGPLLRSDPPTRPAHEGTARGPR
jgi:3-hydroxyisobutyrate dehydrogenase